MSEVINEWNGDQFGIHMSWPTQMQKANLIRGYWLFIVTQVILDVFFYSSIVIHNLRRTGILVWAINIS